MRFKPFTEDEKQFLRENFETNSLRQLARELGRSEGGVKTWIIKLGLRRNKRFIWTDERKAVFEEMYPTHSAQEIADALNTTKRVIYARSRHSDLKKTPEYLAALNKKLGEDLQKNGFANRFQKGQKPWCAGKKIGMRGRTAETAFKKGHKPHNICRVGKIRKPANYWKIKIGEPNVWEFLHIHNWKKVNGEIPPNMCISFKDGNIDNCSIENLECITRGELLKKHWIHNYPDDLKEVIQTIGRLKRIINNKEKKNAQK